MIYGNPQSLFYAQIYPLNLNPKLEFLTFVATGKEEGIQVLYKDETIWATQKAMATLFDVDRSVITKHLKNIFDSNELMMEQVCAKFAHTAEDGKTYQTKFYNLDAIISVGYRVNSIRTKQFRQWCTYVLHQFAIRGYVIDKKRMEKCREGADGAYLLGERPDGKIVKTDVSIANSLEVIQGLSVGFNRVNFYELEHDICAVSNNSVIFFAKMFGW